VRHSTPVLCVPVFVACDVTQCGVVWCGVVWCGVVWCGVVWCGVVWCGVVWCGVVWCGVVWCCVVRCYAMMVCCDVICYDLLRCDARARGAALTGALLPAVTIGTGGQRARVWQEESRRASVCSELLPHTHKLVSQLLQGLGGRAWDGKEGLIIALADVAVHCRTAFDASLAVDASSPPLRLLPTESSDAASGTATPAGVTRLDDRNPARVLLSLARAASRSSGTHAWRRAAFVALGRVCDALQPGVVALQLCCDAAFPTLVAHGVTLTIAAAAPDDAAATAAAGAPVSAAAPAAKTGLVGMRGVEEAEAEEKRAAKEKEAQGHELVCAAVEAVGRAWPSCAPAPVTSAGTAAAGTAADAAVAASAGAGAGAVGGAGVGVVGAGAEGADSDGSSQPPLAKMSRISPEAQSSPSTAALEVQRSCAAPLLTSLVAVLRVSAWEIKASVANALERCVARYAVSS
jgi:hypothetical protein